MTMLLRRSLCLIAAFLISSAGLGQERTASLLLEAESFEQHGGWSLDTQFIRQMGSPYLIAHGLGKPVADATANVTFTETGTYHVFVRTKDWVARWKADGQPGKFQLLVDGSPLKETFGTKGAEWNWQDGGTVEIKSKSVTVALHDLTGFDGRCDAIVFTKGTTPPPDSNDILPAWRRNMLGLKETPTLKSGCKLFCDATGHGTLGSLAGADWTMTDKGRMGMSNMWAWDEGNKSVEFPKTPWALDLSMADFPYPVDHHGQWFWESGFDKDAIGDAEGIRDWNLRAVFGAFNAMKNRDGADKHKTAFLTWIAFIGGPRESRQLLGDYVLNQDDIVTKKEFTDGCVPSTWSIDLHYPKKQYAEKFPDNPFISIAEHDRRIDRDYGYPVPYRCFYSRNIENMFMAGRCISVTHEALGTVRVMKTCGMMGEVVGKAASVCINHDCPPSAVYDRYWSEMDKLLQLPGKAFRLKPTDSMTIPNDSLPLASSYGPPTGLDPANLLGVVIDNRQAKSVGSWTSGTGLNGYVAYDYVYAPADSAATITYEWKADKDMKVEIRLAFQSHENRGKSVPITIAIGTARKEVRVNMKEKAAIDNTFVSLGTFSVKAGDTISIIQSTEKAGGIVHSDAIQILPAP